MPRTRREEQLEQIVAITSESPGDFLERCKRLECQYATLNELEKEFTAANARLVVSNRQKVKLLILITLFRGRFNLA